MPRRGVWLGGPATPRLTVSLSEPRRSAVAISRSAPIKGIGFMVAGSGLITLSDAVMKWLTTGYSIGELLFIRGLFMYLPISILVWKAGGLEVLRVRSWPGQLLRALTVVGSSYFFVTGLRHLTLADTTALAFAGPLFVTALAPLMLGEQVGWRRWAAVLVGFAGVVIMARPTGAALNLAVLLPLGAAFTGAFRDILTRRLSATETSLSILVVSTGVVALSGLATLPLGWAVPSWGDLGMMAFSGMILGLAHYLLIEAFRAAEAAAVAPFKYSTLLWAVLLGAAVFGHVPELSMLVGAALIVASGLYILNREMRRKASA